MTVRRLLPIVCLAGLAVVLWPAFIDRTSGAVQATAPRTAPVLRDYEQRDKLVSFWEGAVAEHHPSDMFSPRQLAAQYLQRYRERGDIDDVLRAKDMAERSLRIMPRNVAALSIRAGVMLTLHRFREALTDVNALVAYDPHGAAFLSQQASLYMELGEYGRAAQALHRIRPSERSGAAAETSRSRYAELSGHLDVARTLLADATAAADAQADEPAAARAWYHFRAGELAFSAGDVATAIADERAALEIFPTYNLALKDLAKFELADGHDADAFAAAQTGAGVTPFAETLGYESDAARALGKFREAQTARALIVAIERLGNAYRVNDRLLAVYYADHHLRLHEAFSIARREAALRGNEIYAQDTLAWAAAMDDRWDIARRAISQATRLHTQDALLDYHAGIIALHFGERTEARRRFAAALSANPKFHPVFAKNARRQLQAIQ